MRQTIFESPRPHVIFADNGVIRQLGTSSDGFYEHKNAEAYLWHKVCTPKPCVSHESTGLELFESMRITRGELFQFVLLPDADDGRPEAVLGFATKPETDLASSKVLNELNFRMRPKSEVATALKYGDFAIRVRGEKLVDGLADFHQAILAGDVALAPGSRLDGKFLRGCGWEEGVVLVNLSTLSEQEYAKLAGDVTESVRRRNALVQPTWMF